MSLHKITIWCSAKAKEGSCLRLELEAVVQQTSGVAGSLFNEVALW